MKFSPDKIAKTEKTASGLKVTYDARLCDFNAVPAETESFIRAAAEYFRSASFVYDPYGDSTTSQIVMMFGPPDFSTPPPTGWFRTPWWRDELLCRVADPNCSQDDLDLYARLFLE